MQNKSRKTLPLFDIDGTLLRGKNELHHRAFTFAIQKSLNITPDLSVLKPAGMLDRNIVLDLLSLQNVANLQGDCLVDRILEMMGSYFSENAYDFTDRVLPGVVDLLSELKRLAIPTGLLTGNVETIAWTKMEKSGLLPFFGPFGGFGDAKVKTRAELIPIAISRANLITGNGYCEQDVVIIGDTPRDIECAKYWGARVIAVATGTYSFESLALHQPDLLVRSLEEKEKIMEFLHSK